MQVPVTVPQQTFLQQIMPYLVMLCVTVITCLIGVVKVYADKLIAQLQANKVAGEKAAEVAQSAADSAQASVTVAASTARALADHNVQASAKLDTIIEQTNGINQALTKTVADQQKQISDLTSKQA